MARPSISVPDSLLREVDDRRHATVDRSAWIRQAIIARLDAEDQGEWSDPGEWEGPDTATVEG